MTRIALVLATTTLTASLAEAQNTSFDRLALLVDPGDAITVTDKDGRRLKGRLLDLSSTTLALQAGGLRHELDGGDISLVRRRERDSLKNGTLNGAVTGLGAAAVPLLILVSHPDVDVGPAGVFLTLSLCVGAGTGIGAGLDALIESSRVIYRASPSRPRLTVSPVLSSERQGLSVEPDRRRARPGRRGRRPARRARARSGRRREARRGGHRRGEGASAIRPSCAIDPAIARGGAAGSLTLDPATMQGPNHPRPPVPDLPPRHRRPPGAPGSPPRR